MMVAVIALSLLVLGEGLMIFALLNRVLMQAKLPVVEMPKWKKDEETETPKERERRKLFSVDIPS